MPVSTRRKEQRRLQRQARHKGEAVVIQKGNKSYVELLKAVRVEIETKDLGDNVKNDEITKKREIYNSL